MIGDSLNVKPMYSQVWHPKQSRTLMLLRHAKSSWKFPELNDHDRPLNSRGKHNAPMMANRIKDCPYQPSTIISSEAVRAKRTAEIMADVLGILVDDIIWDDDIYYKGELGIINAANHFFSAFSEALPVLPTLMIVGHNPGLTNAVNQLCAHDFENIRTCGVVVIKNGELIHHDDPKST